MAPLVRGALEALAAGGAGLDELLLTRLPEAMRPRLEPGGLAARGVLPDGPGSSALVVVAGPGLGVAEIGVVLRPDGGAYTLALRADGRALPAELQGRIPGLDQAAPPPAPGDLVAEEWTARALATLTRPAADLTDDHRWWGDVGALIMLADLLDGQAPPLA